MNARKRHPSGGDVRLEQLCERDLVPVEQVVQRCLERVRAEPNAHLGDSARVISVDAVGNDMDGWMHLWPAMRQAATSAWRSAREKSGVREFRHII
jgi:hypothetical protein